MNESSSPDFDARLARLLDELPACYDPPPGVQDRLEAHLLARLPRATGWWWRRLVLPPLLPAPRPLLVRLVAIPLVLVALLAGAFAASPAARAQLLRFACYVPGFGIQTCDAQGLIAAQVNSVRHGGTTVTVTQLLSTAAGTTVRLEVSGSADLGNALVKATVALRDEHGHTDTVPPRGIDFSAAPSALGAGMAYHLEVPFPALALDAHAVEVTLAGPAPVGVVTVHVPVVPVPLAGLAPAWSGGAAETHQGVTVRVAAVFADARGTDVQLITQAPTSLGTIIGLGGWEGNPGGVDRPLRPITLADDHGRVYQEIPSPPIPHPSSAAPPVGYTDDIAFPPLPADTRSARLTLPYVVFSQELGEVTVSVPVGRAGYNEPIPVQADLALGPDPVRVTGASINPNGCDSPQPAPNCWPVLMLRLDLGGWHGGRKVVMVRPTLVDGQPARFYMGRADPADDVHHWAEVGAPLPAQHGDRVTITLHGGLVAIAGPWQLQIPIAAPTPTAGR